MSWTRREVLREGARMALGAGILLASTGCRESDACVDPDLLTTGQASLRASFHYAARSPHGEAKQCSGCEFFRTSAALRSGCGDCQMLHGPVHAQGYCDSWSARA